LQEKDFLATADLNFSFSTFFDALELYSIEIIYLNFLYHLLNVLSNTAFFPEEEQIIFFFASRHFFLIEKQTECLTVVVLTFEIMSSSKISVCSIFYTKVGTMNPQSRGKKI